MMAYIDLRNPLGSCNCTVSHRVLLVSQDTNVVYTGTYPFDVVNSAGTVLHHATSKADLFAYWNTANPTSEIFSFVPDGFNILSYAIARILVLGASSVVVVTTPRQHSSEFASEFS